MLYREVVSFDHHGQEKRVTIEFGVVPVRLPDIPEKLLHMVVVRGFGQKPMMLLSPKHSAHVVQDTRRARLPLLCHCRRHKRRPHERGRRGRGYDPSETRKTHDTSLFDFFGLNTG